MRFLLMSVLGLLFCNAAIGQTNYEVQANNKVDKPQEILTQEKKYIVENFPFIHMADWKVGMRFIVENDKYGFSLNLELNKYKKSDSKSKGLSHKEFQGKIFTFIGLEERQVPCMRGKCTRTYVLFECNSEKYEYEYIGTIEEMRQNDVSTTIYRLIYIDEIDKARELLVNKKLFFNKAPLAFHNKFIPVTIQNIGIGSTSSDTPVKFVYSDESGKEYSVETKLSGINSRKHFSDLYFYDIFYLDNPRNNYLHISDEIWQVIQGKKVRIGMSMEECILSWGKPSKINSTINGLERTEQWVYSSKSYLYFKDGKLTTIHN